MNKTALLGAFGALFLIAFGASSAQAQATRTWVSGVGDDANPCSRTAPCKTFAGAISKTAASGEIDVLDPGGFGAVTITKAITIAAEGPGEGGVAASGTNGITINAGVNDVVILRGLQIDGAPLSSTAINGVRFLAGAVLEIQNSTIRNFVAGMPNGYGVYFVPSANAGTGATPTQLIITDSTITNNGAVSASTGGGILVQPTLAASVLVSLNNVNIVNGTLGYRADASLTSGTINTSINNSMIANNAFAGVSAFTFGAASGTAASTIDLKGTTIANNGGAGVNSNGTNASMRLIGSTITGNKTGVVVANSGVVNSTVTNMIYDNTNPGSTPTTTAAN